MAAVREISVACCIWRQAVHGEDDNADDCNRFRNEFTFAVMKSSEVVLETVYCCTRDLARSLDPFRAPEPLPTLHSSDVVPKTGFQLQRG